MKKLAAALALFALLAQGASAAGRVYTLTAPRAPTAEEELALEIRTGVLPRGAEIDVISGLVFLGIVSPFAVRGHAAGAYRFPLKGVTQRGARVIVRLVVTRFGDRPRAPTAREVPGVTLVYIHVSR